MPPSARLGRLPASGGSAAWARSFPVSAAIYVASAAVPGRAFRGQCEASLSTISSRLGESCTRVQVLDRSDGVGPGQTRSCRVFPTVLPLSEAARASRPEPTGHDLARHFGLHIGSPDDPLNVRHPDTSKPPIAFPQVGGVAVCLNTERARRDSNP